MHLKSEISCEINYEMEKKGQDLHNGREFLNGQELQEFPKVQEKVQESQKVQVSEEAEMLYYELMNAMEEEETVRSHIFGVLSIDSGF